MANKKTQNVAVSEDEDGNENGGVEEVAAKPAAKKAGRPKKAPGTSKAAKNAKAKAAYDGPKRGRGRPKTTETESAEDDAASVEEQEEEEPTAKKAKSTPAPKKTAAVAESKKGRGRPKKV